ncbi:MAG: hypothetical protein WA798_14820, partial [Candidatus Acidiferrum sp.]
MLRAPKSASALFMEENGEEKPPGPEDGESPADATWTGGCAFGLTAEPFAQPTAACSKAAFAVKFWRICKVPPK